MTTVTIFHHSADHEQAARIAAGLRDWGLAAEPAAGDTSPAVSTAALILWTGHSSLDPAFLAAWAQRAGLRRVDLALGDVAAPALGPVRLTQWADAGTGDPAWPVLVDRLTTAAYGDPSRPREEKAASPAVVPAVPMPAPDAAVVSRPAPEPDRAVPPAPAEDEAPAVAADVRFPSLARAAPWVVWGAVLFLIALFMLSPAILETQPVGTAFPDRELGNQDLDIYLISTVWTPLFLTPLFLWLRSAGRIGWAGAILFVGAISGVHFFATYGGYMAAMLTMKDSVLGATLFFGSVIGSACSFILLMIYRPLRKWEVVKTAMLCAAILAAAAMLPLLAQSDGRLFPVVLFPLWQVLFGLGVVCMFARAQTPADTSAA